jgi:Flp pilus assembly protein TadG
VFVGDTNMGRSDRSRHDWLLSDTRGMQLAEMALALPILFLFLCGIADFGQAFNIRQELSNAAREGARFGASESDLDLLSGGTPPSVQAIGTVVQNYLTNAGLNCPIGGAGQSGFLQWTFTSYTGCSITINRDFQMQVGGRFGFSTSATATHVTISYPYIWLMPRIFGRRVGRRWPQTIGADAYMENSP